MLIKGRLWYSIAVKSIKLSLCKLREHQFILLLVGYIEVSDRFIRWDKDSIT